MPEQTAREVITQELIEQPCFLIDREDAEELADGITHVLANTGWSIVRTDALAAAEADHNTCKTTCDRLRDHVDGLMAENRRLRESLAKISELGIVSGGSLAVPLARAALAAEPTP